MRSIIALSISAALLVSCASGPSSYQLYAETQAKIAQANAVAETARFNALAEIAKSGDNSAKVAAVLSIQMGQGFGGQPRPVQTMVAPEDAGDKLLRWAGVLIPGITQGLGVMATIHAANSQKQIAVTQSNNALATAQSNNGIITNMSNNMTTLGTAGINGVVSATNNFNSALSAQSTQSNAALNTMSSGYRSSLDAAISKLTGTTTTTNNYVSCASGQSIVAGVCQ